NVFKQMTHVDAAFELEILDLAAFFYRDEIMPDLILTRQFELIPCCLSLLIHLGPKIVELQAKSEDKHEQLLQLQRKDDYAKWWMDEKRYPADYLRFLQFQAIQFRRCRHRLLRDSQWNKNDFDLVTARTANELSDLKSELQEMLENFKRKEEDRQHRHDSPNDSKQKSREMDHSERTATPEYDLTQETQENRQIQTLLEELNERRNESVEKLTKLEERMTRQRRRIKDMESKLDKLLELAEQQHHAST
uniref:Dzip-like_N domain-containing protein n=1 Tax=Macrostomum lignano TaxID=282301 RepID=A0A1I8G3P4_9PLAT